MKKLNLLICLLLINSLTTSAQSWEKIQTGFNYIFKGIAFPGGQSQVGFAGGQSVTYMGDGIVIKTTNGGSSWTQLWTGTQQGVEGISFPDMNTGYICGWSAYFAKTTNGGVNWTPQSPGTDIYYYTDVVFKDATHGVVAAQTNTGAAVYSTINGGSSWIPGTGLSAIPYKLCYVTGSTYFLVTNSGDIQKSTDDGLTWTTVYAAGGLLTGIDFYNPMIGMAASEDGRIVKTYDGGATWTQQVIASGYPLWHDFAWANQNDVYVCGTPEQIYKSTDGGATWTDDYPQSTFDPALYEILFTADGVGYCCGSQGWFYRNIAQVTAAFTASNTHVCNGGSIQFTDQSLGSPTSWSWTFQGGTPSTSTQQNPLVTYSTAGIYDVSLTVTKGVATNTATNTGMIHVEAPVTVAPIQPSGPTQICGLFDYEYTTASVPNATGYSWTVTPATAGIISGTGLTGTLTASNTWEGAFTIKTAGTNACGSGPVSPELNGSLSHQPNVFSLFSGGGYCNGQAGYEIKLEDSDLGVDYQLFKDVTALGVPLAGTGNLLSFGLQPAGTYTVTGSTVSCFANMQGIATNYLIDPVAATTQPTGSSSVCAGTTGTYSAVLPANGYTLLWTLTPPEAGVITQPTTATASITWNPGFSGAVSVTVQGQNECGPGAASPALSVMVNAVPAPLVAGFASVCKAQESDYSCSYNTGSTYVWVVTGGTIAAGAGSNQVTILWGDPGNGSVSVTETSAASCIGSSPVFPVVISECTGIAENKAEVLDVFPNPASVKLNVILGSFFKTPANISVYDHLGQIVYQSAGIKTGGNTLVTIDISHFSAGTYILRVSTENEVLSRVFVKK